MTRQARWLALLCGLWIASVQPAHAQGPEPKCREELAAAPANALLDLNQASRDELEKLPGIGPAKAEAIVAFRDARGGFSHVNQLLRIRGIGRAMLRKLAPLVTVSSPTRQTPQDPADRVR